MSMNGQKAPGFCLLGSDGKEHRLEDYAGRYVILYFYPKDDTPGCTREACGFSTLHSRILRKNAVVLGVSRDGNDSHQAFIKKFRLSFVLLSDPDASVHKAYCAWGEKVIYGKATEGVIRSTVLINPSGIVVKHWNKIKKADEHPAEVLEFLSKM